jgi:hypothetical protein
LFTEIISSAESAEAGDLLDHLGQRKRKRNLQRLGEGVTQGIPNNFLFLFKHGICTGVLEVFITLEGTACCSVWPNVEAAGHAWLASSGKQQEWLHLV